MDHRILRRVAMMVITSSVTNSVGITLEGLSLYTKNMWFYHHPYIIHKALFF
jgi:hypothetical protein